MKDTKKKESFFAKKSVFITLAGLVAVGIISITMTLAIRKDTQQQLEREVWEESVNQSANAEVFEEQPAQSVNGTVHQEELQTETPPENTSTEPKPSPDSAPPETKMALMEKPVPGGITKDYSGDQLVYSDTMRDWRVHEGIDFAAEEKAQVKAAADGTVEAVLQDGLFGACITISHPDGIQTFYGNLAEGSMPEIGTQVKAGQVIGRIGKTATVEINDKSHLHFEVRKNGQPINPHQHLADTVTDDE